MSTESLTPTNVFGTLRAEAERWLPTVFVPPPGFERMIASRSTIIFGSPGSGKTTIYRELQRRSLSATGHPRHLLVDWRPAPLPPGVDANLAWVRRQVLEILDKCAKTLAQHLATYPHDYKVAPAWTKTRLRWFIRRYLQGNPQLRLEPLGSQGPEAGNVIKDLLNIPIQDVLYPDSPPDQIMAELVNTLQGLNLDSVWIMSDGLTGWTAIDTEHVVRGLGAFLSTLTLFERAGLIYKLIASADLLPTLSRASGIARRRLDSMLMCWDAASLRRVVEIRASLVLGKEDFVLENLCEAKEFYPWLQAVGGQSPRTWLDQVAPLVRHSAENDALPIDRATWLKLRQSHPPRLYLDEEAGRVFVGGREIDLAMIPTKAYDMLRYLYKRGEEVVSKAELYYLGYCGLKRVPVIGEKHWEEPDSYEGTIDTNLWRLRKVIEPDPSHPVLLETVRKYGIRLHVRW